MYLEIDKLHWLPVKARIEYKICTIVYQCVNDQSFPQYLKELIKMYAPVRSLRTANEMLLHVPRSKLHRYGDRTFPAAGPVLWNKLPKHLREAKSLASFKSNLKTFLFTKYYS